jgi:hypothetical protein
MNHIWQLSVCCATKTAAGMHFNLFFPQS